MHHQVFIFHAFYFVWLKSPQILSVPLSKSALKECTKRYNFYIHKKCPNFETP